MTDSGDKARIYDESKGDSNNSIPFVLSVIAVVLAVIAVILGAVSLSREGVNNYNFDGGVQTKTNRDNSYDDKIWTMATGHEGSRFAYLDEVSGLTKGFFVDMVNQVCTIANKNCRLTDDLFQNCWDAEAGQINRGGVGLYSGWYDACTGWQHSYVRTRTFQFSDSFSVTLLADFVVKTGNPRSFNWQDLTGKKIGIIDGFVFDEFCLLRENIMGTPLSTDNIIHYMDPDAFLYGILNDEVDAGFSYKRGYDQVVEVEVLNADITSCSIAGFSMMVPKDSRLPEWWNPALERLMATTLYRDVCNDLLEQHGHFPGPKPEDICLGL